MPRNPSNEVQQRHQGPPRSNEVQQRHLAPQLPAHRVATITLRYPSTLPGTQILCLRYFIPWTRAHVNATGTPWKKASAGFCLWGATLDKAFSKGLAHPSLGSYPLPRRSPCMVASSGRRVSRSASGGQPAVMVTPGYPVRTSLRRVP